MPYTRWAFERFSKRVVCYLVLFPICLALLPFTMLGNGLSRVFYSWREW